MGTKPAARTIKRRLYPYVVGGIGAYVVGTTLVTVYLWRRRLIHDAVSLGSYATAVLAVSTIALFAATGLLAAATVDLVRTESEEARREEEKYENEHAARIAEEKLRTQQSKIYSLQINELEQRVDDQRRAQARQVRITVLRLGLALPDATTRRCTIVRVENHSDLPIRNCLCTITHPDGVSEVAQPGTVSGPFEANAWTEFTAIPGTVNAVQIDAGQHADFAFLNGVEHTGQAVPVAAFTDTNGTVWCLDAGLVLAPRGGALPTASSLDAAAASVEASTSPSAE